MSYCKDYVARYLSAENSKRINEVLDMFDKEQLEYILNQISLLWEADSNQQKTINQIKMQINNVSLLFCTQEEYESFSVKPQTTLYIVKKPDNSISLYAGETEILGGSCGVRVEELSRSEYDAIEAHSLDVIYVVTEADSSISVYLGTYQLNGGGDTSELERRVTTIESQITTVNLRFVTREQYDNLGIHYDDTLYIVQEENLLIKLYAGNTLINSKDEGGRVVLGLSSLILGIVGKSYGFVAPAELGIGSTIINLVGGTSYGETIGYVTPNIIGISTIQPIEEGA